MYYYLYIRYSGVLFDAGGWSNNFDFLFEYLTPVLHKSHSWVRRRIIIVPNICFDFTFDYTYLTIVDVIRLYDSYTYLSIVDVILNKYPNLFMSIISLWQNRLVGKPLYIFFILHTICVVLFLSSMYRSFDDPFWF